MARAAGVAAVSPRMEPGARPAGLAQAAIVLVLLAAVYHRTAAELWRTWTTNDNYSHGPLIPVVALALVWSRRARLAAAPPGRDARGLLLVALACVLQIAGVRGDVFALQGWSLVVMLCGLSLALLGSPVTRLLAFPILYLAFMLTFPPFVMNQLSYALKEVTVRLSTRAAELLGVAIQRSGMTLYLARGVLEIENPCSGLRSLLAMLAAGTLFAYLQPGGWVRRGTLVLLAVPIAMAANALRITLLILVAHYASVKRAVGTFHDVTGYLTFALALAALLAARAALRPRGAAPRRTESPA
ncbi:MAG: exosortase/archaeosortase family protein [Candidatus Eisenbacteria bacterium]|nr:exosortase/archaeosortase family protein [Candidatus Eisenbacteria bacterium]